MSDPPGNGLYDIPDYEHIEDEAFPPLPPPFSPGEGEGEEDGNPLLDAENEADMSALAEVPAAKRRGVKRPHFKLDSQRLTSDRGLPALRSLFNNIHFKGKGHESEDLRVLMQSMENWAHRLYPKLQFDDFIDKVETLGSKKEVQTCLKRIRLDMPLTHEDFIGPGEETAAREEGIHGEPDPLGDSSLHEDPLELVHSTPAAPSLTEEQQLRIRLNKQLALERRLACKQQTTDSSQSASSRPEEEPLTGSSPHVSSQQHNGGGDHEDDIKDLELEGEWEQAGPPEQQTPAHTVP